MDVAQASFQFSETCDAAVLTNDRQQIARRKGKIRRREDSQMFAALDCQHRHSIAAAQIAFAQRMSDER